MSWQQDPPQAEQTAAHLKLRAGSFAGSRLAVVTTKLAASDLHIGRQELGGWRLRHVELRVGTGELEIEEV